MATGTSLMYENDTIMSPNLIERQGGPNLDIMVILQNTIASVGIVANFIVVIVFLNDRKLTWKIPNMFIINQVSKYVKLYSGVVYGVWCLVNCTDCLECTILQAQLWWPLHSLTARTIIDNNPLQQKTVYFQCIH